MRLRQKHTHTTNTTIGTFKSISLCSTDRVRVASSFDPFFRRPSALTMANPTVPPSLIPPATTYRDYFSCAETDTFCVCYADVLAPHKIDPTASSAAVAPADVARLIYAVEQEGIPTSFLQWHQGKSGGARTDIASP